VFHFLADKELCKGSYGPVRVGSLHFILLGG
jgi:hypothetical protein